MLERNPCFASGCKGFCCENIEIEITNEERTRLFPQAIKVRSKKAIEDLINKGIKGVYFTKYSREGLTSEGFVLLSLNGPCPNRNPEGLCSKHEERSHAARNYKFGCEECNAIREKHNLAPVFVEPVE